MKLADVGSLSSRASNDNSEDLVHWLHLRLHAVAPDRCGWLYALPDPSRGELARHGRTNSSQQPVPHVKRVLDRALSNDLLELAGVVLLNSCNAMRRLADAWQKVRPKCKE